MKVEITRLECKRCGHVWIPKQEEVRICPHCKSPYWDKDRRKKKKSEIATRSKDESAQ